MSALGGGPVSELITPGQKLLAAPGEWLIYTAGSVATNQNFTNGMGERFVVASGQSITVTGLAVFVHSGATTNGTPTLRVWNLGTNTIVPGLNEVMGAGPYDLVAGNYRAVYVAPVVLNAGTYLVEARGNALNYNENGTGTLSLLSRTLGGKVSWTGSFYNGSDTTPPNIQSGVPPAPMHFGLASLLAS